MCVSTAQDVYKCGCVCPCTCVKVKAQPCALNSLQLLDVGSTDGTQAPRLVQQVLYPQRYLISPRTGMY